MKKISAFLVLLAMVAYAAPVRFLGIDESRGQLIYVNTKNAAENWALKLPENAGKMPRLPDAVADAAAFERPSRLL